MGEVRRRQRAGARDEVRVPAVVTRRRRRHAGSRMPAAAVVVALVGLAVFFVLPLVGLLWRAPWADVWSVLGDDASRQALRLSLVCSLSATAISAFFGFP